jgi:hypothetical protein
MLFEYLILIICVFDWPNEVFLSIAAVFAQSHFFLDRPAARHHARVRPQARLQVSGGNGDFHKNNYIHFTLTFCFKYILFNGKEYGVSNSINYSIYFSLYTYL